MNIRDLIVSPGGLADWARSKWAWDEYRALADEVQDAKLAGEGRGIVTCGGGTKYFPSLWVMVNRLRQLGNRLPVEVWHLGEQELDPAMKRLLSELGCSFVDAYEVRKTRPFRRLNGWELKAFSLLHTKFREVLFLDADCAPVRDPYFLFNSPEYHEHGAILWPDFPNWMMGRKGTVVGGICSEHAYEVFGCEKPANVEPPMGGNDMAMAGKAIDPTAGWDVPVESGQMVFDRVRCSAALTLAAHFCEYSEFYFQHVHGDKECFHLAFRRAKQSYAMPMWWPAWDSHTCMQFDFEGGLVFAHRNMPHEKWNMRGNSRGTGRIPQERLCFALMEELRARWNGRPWFNGTPGEDEALMGSSLCGSEWYYHRRDGDGSIDARLVRFGEKQLIDKGNADNERYWSVWKQGEDAVLSIIGAKGPTCNLVKRGDRWTGRWFIGEKCEVTLVPAGGAA